MRWVLVAWLAAVGGCVGSFLNVVVYRMPTGLSIVRPRSRCPRCMRPIRAFDNIPVISWFVLRGRCRDCGTRISFRYAAIEAGVAGLFGTLAIVEVFSAGANLPLGRLGVAPLPAWGVYAYHLLLLCTLLCAALVQWDGHRVAWALFIPAGLAGLFAPLVWPAFRPISASGFDAAAWQAQSATAAAGLAAGAVLGWIVGQLAVPRKSRRAFKSRSTGGSVATTALCGLMLGWQAVSVAACLAVVALVAVAFSSRGGNRPVGAAWGGCLAGATLLLIVVWRELIERFSALGHNAPVTTFAASIVFVAAVAFTAGWTSQRRQPRG